MERVEVNGADPLNHEDTDPAAVAVGSPDASLAEVEEAHIRRVLSTARSLEDAARILGIDKVTLYRKRKRMGLA